MGVKRGSCRSCGTPLTYQSDQWPDETHLLIGVFDNPAPFTPASDYLIEEGLGWVRQMMEKR